MKSRWTTFVLTLMILAMVAVGTFALKETIWQTPYNNHPPSATMVHNKGE